MNHVEFSPYKTQNPQQNQTKVDLDEAEGAELMEEHPVL